VIDFWFRQSVTDVEIIMETHGFPLAQLRSDGFSIIIYVDEEGFGGYNTGEIKPSS